MKKTLSLALALMLLLSLFTVSTAFAEEKRKLTIGGDVDISNIFEWDVYKKAQEDLNIEIDFTFYSEDSFNAMLAGNDMPDIVLSKNKTTKILDNNLAMDLTPLLEEYAPNILGETYAEALTLTKEMMGGEENAVYVLCPVVGPHVWNGGTYMTERGYAVHWEYYKEIGCPPINNDDEYIEVLKAMYANHPTTEDGSPTYLIGINSTYRQMGGFRACFLSGVDLNYWSSSYLYYADIFDNELVNCYTDVDRSAYWIDMEFYNKIYRTGLFDMDAFTMTSDEYNAKIAKNQYMGLFVDYADDYVIVPTPAANVYTNIMLSLGNAPASIIFIPQNSDNWQLALEFLNYIYNPDFSREAYSGVQGKDWDYDENGVPSLTEESIAAIAAGDEYWASNGNGYGIRMYTISGYNPAMLHPDGYPMNLAMTPEALIATQDELMRDYCEVYDVEFWHDAFAKAGAKDFRNSAQQIGAAITEIPMEIQRILTTCDDIMYTAMPSLIMAESDEEFAELREEVLAELAAAGQEEAWAWYSAAWEAPRAIFNDLLAEAVPAAGLELYPVE